MVAPTTPSADYPANLSFDPPETITRWRPLVQWFLAIPHFFVLYVLRMVSQVLGVVSWFIILFTGRLPEGIAGFQAMYLRYSARVSTYAGFLQEEYPPFSFTTANADPGDYAHLRVDVEPELDGRNRLTTFFRLILAIPQLIVVFLLTIAASVVTLISLFVVLFTGRWNDGMRDFVVGFLRWNLRVEAYLSLLTDQYPPFSMGGGTQGVGAPTSPGPSGAQGWSASGNVKPA